MSLAVLPRYLALQVDVDKQGCSLQEASAQGQPAVPRCAPRGKAGQNVLVCLVNSSLLSWAESCVFALHAKEGEITTFTTPGFPNSPYPNNALCYWALRADANSIISLTFKTLELEQCTDDSDYIKVYNSLSPVEPHALVR